MSLGHGSSIVRDGLVFYYDSANAQKSWNGAPATNLFTETNLVNWSKTATVALSSYNTPFGNPSYSVYDGNTSSYLSISRSITVANDTSSYTLGLFVRKTTGGTSARLGFNSGFDTGGTTVAYNQRFNSDTGVATSGSVIDYGDWWYWYFTITNNGTGNTNLYCQFYPATGPYNSTDAATATGTAIVGEMMLVAGSTAARFVSGTRSNTQALLDLTNTNTITANSLTYASNNTFTFNGTNNSITIGQTLDYIPALSNFTLETWLRVPAFPTAAANNAYGQTDRAGVLFGATYYCGAALYWRGNSTGTSLDVFAFIRGQDLYRETSSKSISLNTWTHLVMVNNYTASKIQFYVDGLLYHETTGATQEYDSSLTPTAGNIGLCKAQIDGGGTRNYSNLNCEVPIARIYKNKALTAAEVKQNFEALRGRYGI